MYLSRNLDSVLYHDLSGTRSVTGQIINRRLYPDQGAYRVATPFAVPILTPAPNNGIPYHLYRVLIQKQHQPAAEAPPSHQ
jgi:hypothetical protein